MSSKAQLAGEVFAGGGAEGPVAAEGALADRGVDVDVGVGQAGEELLRGRVGLLPGGVVEEDAGAVLVVGLGVVDDAAEPVAQRRGVAPPAVVGLLGEQLGGMSGGCGDGGEAGLGGGVAFGVDDVDVEAAGEAELGEAQQGLGLAGAGEAEDDGPEAQGAGGEGAPLPRSPAGQVAADPGAEHRCAVVVERRSGRSGSRLSFLGGVFGAPSGLRRWGEVVGGEVGDAVAGEAGGDQSEGCAEGELAEEPDGPAVGDASRRARRVGCGEFAQAVRWWWKAGPGPPRAATATRPTARPRRTGGHQRVRRQVMRP